MKVLLAGVLAITYLIYSPFTVGAEYVSGGRRAADNAAGTAATAVSISSKPELAASAAVCVSAAMAPSSEGVASDAFSQEKTGDTQKAVQVSASEVSAESFSATSFVDAPEAYTGIIDVTNTAFQFGGYGGEQSLAQRFAADGTVQDPAGAAQALATGFVNRWNSMNLTPYAIPVALLPQVFADALNSNPRLFYVLPRAGYSTNGNIVTSFYPQYSTEYTDADMAAYDAKIQQALSTLNSTMNNEQKALALHDYLANCCQYDYSYTNYNAYNALVEGSAVCQGYTLAYEQLLQECGIPNTTLISSSMNHIWNLVEIGGSWYHVDVTWDSTVPGRVRHSNFLRSNSGIQITGHNSWDATPIACTDTRYDNNAFWQKVSGTITFSGNNCYYTDGSGNNTSLVQHRADGSSITLAQYASSVHSNVVCCGCGLYYNAENAVCYYSFATESSRICAVPAAEGKHLCGVILRDDGVQAVLVSNAGSDYSYQAVNNADGNFTGLCKCGGSWYYFRNGKLDDTYNGVVAHETGTWAIANGKINFDANGVVQVNSTDWYYVKGGQVQTNYNGVASNAGGTWVIANGKVNFGANGVVQVNSTDWHYVKGGQVQTNYYGLASNAGGTWMIVNGKVDFGVNGVTQVNSTDWYYIKGGQAQLGYYGIASNGAGTWVIADGKVNFGANGVVQVNSTDWHYAKGGQVQTSYNGVASNPAGTWVIVNGKVNFGANGVVQVNSTDWYYAKGGQVQTSYYGLTSNAGGTWMIINGKLDFSINDVMQVNSTDWYYIKGGQAQLGYDGVASNVVGTWVIVNGKVNFGANGVVQVNSTDWYYAKGGQVQTNYNGLVSNCYIVNGRMDLATNGVREVNGTLYYFASGRVDSAFKGTVRQDGKTYRVENGIATQIWLMPAATPTPLPEPSASPAPEGASSSAASEEVPSSAASSGAVSEEAPSSVASSGAASEEVPSSAASSSASSEEMPSSAASSGAASEEAPSSTVLFPERSAEEQELAAADF